MAAGLITERKRSAVAERVPLVCEYPRQARAAAVRFLARHTEDDVTGLGVSRDSATHNCRLAYAWQSRETGKHK